ncbi:MAG: 50S ribosomal protein L32 [Candidatus Eremiobacteraeota bacterium]|nr:50S ribosomal protein L32 [Candidatus Eremiobacteraeota bacterium]
MANPKQKTSKSHTRSRRRNWKAQPVDISSCPQCHRPRRPHFACSHCGNYNGRLAIAREDEKAPAKAKA